MATKRKAAEGALVASPATALVTFENGQARTTSLLVAERFGKEHRNVLRDIRRLIEDCPDQGFHLLNFEQVFYFDEAGQGAKRKQPMYRLTKDGFVLLAMGFTGDEALRWKIDFIKAFNAMEQALREPRVPVLVPALPGSLHDQNFATFLEITRGRIHRNADGSTHNTVSVNTAKLLHWLWQQPSSAEWMSANRSWIGRELDMDHTSVRRTFRRLESWQFLTERRSGPVVECRLNRELIAQEIRTANASSAPVMIAPRVQ